MLEPDLDYCVEWKKWLWLKPTRRALGDTERFRGKTVLDLGCRYGRMSCYFAGVGAQVVGVDTDPEVLAVARQETAKWGLEQNVTLEVNSGVLSELGRDRFDFVFTKSVFVLIGDQKRALEDICRLLKDDGEYIAIENLAVGGWLTFLRHHLWHRKWKDDSPFKGIDRDTFKMFSSKFERFSYYKHHGLVVAMNARRPLLR